MIEASVYSSLGALLQDALIQFKTNTALIEVRRKNEKHRLTYLQFKHAAMPLARRMQDIGVGPGTRVAILMSNQSAWLITAYAALFRGAVIIPLDYKLTAPEQVALLEHSQPHLLVAEYGFFRHLEALDVPHCWVTEAPKRAELGSVQRWEDTPTGPAPDFVERSRLDEATIVYSSGTGGSTKGCVLSHGAYLSQWEALSELYPMEPGDRYFSILPTNHAIDFMCGFIGPLCCGAAIVHQRTLRPELLRWTMKKYEITHMAVVPLVLEAFARGIEEQLEERPAWQRSLVEGLSAVNGALTRRRPRQEVSRTLLRPIHEAFGGRLKLLFCGGAFVDRSLAERFYRLGLPVVIGYGLTEACTVVTVNDLKPFRADSVGRAVAGTEIRIAHPDAHGVGEVQVRGPTVMRGYLNDPDLTAEVFDGDWLKTGDLGYLDGSFHLHLVGRSRNMIVTAGGKNIYPEDIEGAFSEVKCAELAVFAANYVWPQAGLMGEQLIAVIRPDSDGGVPSTLSAVKRHNHRLPDFKRLGGVVVWEEDFPRTASMKIKRNELAARLRDELTRGAIQSL